MTKIKILKSTPVALDGIHTKLFVKDVIYPNEKQGISDEDMIMLVEDLKIAEFVDEEIKPKRKDPVKPSEIKPAEPSEKKNDEDDSDEEDELVEDPEEDGIRVYELARKYDISTAAILNAAKKMKIGATAPASKLTAMEAAKIKEYIGIE